MANHSLGGRIRSASALAFIAVLVAACTNPHPAPIVHRAPGGQRAVASGPTPLPLPSTTSGSGAVVTPIPGGAIAGASGAVRTTPDGRKQPYSDQTLANARAIALPPLASAPASLPPDADPARSSGPSAAGFIWPASGAVIQTFSEPRNLGMWIAGKPGDPVVAASAGRVIFSGKGPRGYGNLVIIKHSDDILSVYAHNRALLVKEGASVRRGQRIAELGSSDSDRPKLHFEIRKDSKPVDPARYLPSR